MYVSLALVPNLILYSVHIVKFVVKNYLCYFPATLDIYRYQLCVSINFSNHGENYQYELHSFCSNAVLSQLDV